MAEITAHLSASLSGRQPQAGAALIAILKGGLPSDSNCISQLICEGFSHRIGVRYAWNASAPGTGTLACPFARKASSDRRRTSYTRVPGTDSDWRFGALVWKGHLLDLLGRRAEAVACYLKALKVPGAQGMHTTSTTCSSANSGSRSD